MNEQNKTKAQFTYELKELRLLTSTLNTLEPEQSGKVIEQNLAEEAVNKQLDELQRWHNVTQGRKDRIRELKLEINELLVHFDEPLRYSNQETGKANEKLDGFDKKSGVS